MWELRDRLIRRLLRASAEPVGPYTAACMYWAQSGVQEDSNGARNEAT